jgi:class 3 adenylate cyclase
MSPPRPSPEGSDRSLPVRALAAVHGFFSDAPPGLDAERRDAFAFTNWSMSLALMAHATYLLLFAALGLSALAAFNVLSVAMFAACVVLAKRGWTSTTMLLACVEVFVHAVLATLYLGYAAGFHYHMMLVLVICFLFTWVPLAQRLATAAGVAAAYGGLVVWSVGHPPWVEVDDAVRSGMLALNVVVFATTLGGICWYYTFAVQTARAALAVEFQRSESLLHNILPVSIADRLKADRTIADRFEACTVLFADIEGFTAWSQRVEPEELVSRLNEIFSAFDEMAQRHGLEKIKTIGDAYMVAAGIPDARPDHAEAMAGMALEMQAFVVGLRESSGVDLAIRVGMHSGPAVAGVIGLRKFIYDLWGDTVNTAARMESHGERDVIQVTDDTAMLLRDRFVLTDRGRRLIKGKGEMHTWVLVGRRDDA